MRLRILLPTDFSPLSELAGQIARDMAKQAGARLHVLHVVPRPCPILTVPGVVVKRIDNSAPASGPAAVRSRPCLMCGHTSEDLVCDVCRNRIRAEAPERRTSCSSAI
jgi:hypothetical protein